MGMWCIIRRWWACMCWNDAKDVQRSANLYTAVGNAYGVKCMIHKFRRNMRILQTYGGRTSTRVLVGGLIVGTYNGKVEWRVGWRFWQWRQWWIACSTAANDYCLKVVISWWCSAEGCKTLGVLTIQSPHYSILVQVTLKCKQTAKARPLRKTAAKAKEMVVEGDSTRNPNVPLVYDEGQHVMNNPKVSMNLYVLRAMLNALIVCLVHWIDQGQATMFLIDQKQWPLWTMQAGQTVM